MVAGTASLLLLFSVFMSASGGQRFMSRRILIVADEIITAESGQDVTLTCRAPNNKIRAVEWNREDLTDEYVLLYLDGHFDPDIQHPSFKNRVDLQDRQMKDGDVSLILRDVNTADSGTYECRVFMEQTHSWKPIIIIHLIVVDPPDQKIITAESGQDVTLTCRAPNNNIIVVKWSRADLGDEYVLLYRDRQFFPDNQHPSFRNRVDLQDRQMKDGDVSLILNDVKINDAGTYECGVFMEETRSWKFISIIYLHVVPPGRSGWHRKDGLYELTIGLGVALSLCFLIAVVGFCTYICRLSRGERPVNRNTKHPHQTRQQNYEMDHLRTDFRL